MGGLQDIPSPMELANTDQTRSMPQTQIGTARPPIRETVYDVYYAQCRPSVQPNSTPTSTPLFLAAEPLYAQPTPYRYSACTYMPGEMSLPFLPESCSQPPANASPPVSCANFCMRASSSGLKWRMRPWMGQANASPRATHPSANHHHVRGGTGQHIPQIVWPSTCFVSSWSMSISRSRPMPFSKRCIICSVHLLPSRQGVHWPQLSWR